MLQLEFPNISHKKMYEKMIEEWRETEEIPTSPSRLFAGENFEEFLSLIKNDVDSNGNNVNSHLFFLINSDEILWAIQVRHHINHPNLKEVGGHIGYGIKPLARKKWYATKMLKLCLEEVKKLQIKKLLITCDEWNIGSKKVIENNGGVFERMAEKKGKKSYRYWITID